MISFSSIFVKLVQVGPGAAGFYRMLFGALALIEGAVMTKLGSSGFSGALGKTADIDLFRIVDVPDGDGSRIVFVDQRRVGVRGAWKPRTRYASGSRS